MTGISALSVRNVTKNFGGLIAVNEILFEVFIHDSFL